MVKLIIFFRKPADVDAFEEHFASTHVPLINAMPNLRRAAVTRALGAPRGEPPYYLIHEAYFEDMPSLTYALNTHEGRAAGADLMVFAREIVSLMFAEVWGEDPFELGLMGSEPAPIEATATPAPEPAAQKSNLVPIDTSFLENPVKTMAVEEAILGPDYKQAAPAAEEAPAAPITDPNVAESAATDVPAQAALAESAATDVQTEAQTAASTLSDKPALAGQHPQ